MIPAATINKIRAEADIVKIISEYIKLEKQSGNFVGLCPFHPDQNPSLSVSPTKKIYKCFSCGASGNVITFIKEFEKVSFPRAVQIAGEKSGIIVELGNDKITQSYEKYYQILEKATNFYEFLLKNTADGQDALKYLYKRKLNDEIIKRFRIGVSPKESDLLYQSLLKEKFQPLDMIEAGVVRSGANYYDAFRNRIMFPLEDISGNIVGFSGRIYHNKKDNEPKYLNSFESDIFKKGDILYNYHQAQTEIRSKDQVFLFEGFMDVIAAYRAKIYNAIATMGTSLTTNHIKAIFKATKNVVICFDGDSPGIEATKKVIHQLTDAQFNVKAVYMPEGLDPDEFIDKHGEEELNNYLHQNAISGIDYLYEAEKRKLDISDLNSIENFKNEIFKYMHLYKSNVLNEIYLQKLSKDINISLESLTADFTKSIPREKLVDHLPDFVLPAKIEKRTKKSKYENCELILIKKIYYQRDLVKDAVRRLNSHFVNDNSRDIIFSLDTYYTNHNEWNEEAFKNNLTNEQIEILVSILNNNQLFYDFIEIDFLIDEIKKYKCEKEMKKIKEEMADDSSVDKLESFKNQKKQVIKIVNKEIKE